MEHLWNIVVNIPWWVFVLLAYGIWQGIRSLRERTIAVWSLAVFPLVFMALGISSVLSLLTTASWVALLWAVALLVGLLTGWTVLSVTPVSADREKHTVVRPGSWQTLVFFLIIFSDKFALGYTQATHPELATQANFLALLFGVSGWLAGTVAGGNARLYTRYRWLVNSRPSGTFDSLPTSPSSESSST